VTYRIFLARFAQGTLGLTVNIALLVLLLAVEPNRITLTESEQHWRKQVVTVFGCVVNLLLAGAGIGLGLTLSIKAADSKPLIAPLILASIQAYVEPESPRIHKPGCLLLLPSRVSQTDHSQTTGVLYSRL
jgi:hypothetical protein